MSIDHRRGPAFAPGDGVAYLQAAIDLAPRHSNFYVEVVHRLSDLGAVCTHAAYGISREGLDAEWRGIDFYSRPATESTVARSSTRQISMPRSQSSTN